MTDDAIEKMATTNLESSSEDDDDGSNDANLDNEKLSNLK